MGVRLFGGIEGRLSEMRSVCVMLWDCIEWRDGGRVV